jgi:hypothetical protein
MITTMNPPHPARMEEMTTTMMKMALRCFLANLHQWRLKLSRPREARKAPLKKAHNLRGSNNPLRKLNQVPLSNPLTFLPLHPTLTNNQSQPFFLNLPPLP